MSRNTLICTVMLGTIALHGCSLWEIKYGKDKPSISYVQLPSNESDPQGNRMSYDKIYAWRPDSSVAYIFQDQKNGQHPACIASADVAKATTTNDALTLSLGKLIAQQGDVEGSAAQTVTEQLTLLTNKGAAGAFLNVALFNICMINGAGQLDHNDLVQLITHALDIAGKLAAGNAGDPGTTHEPQPAAAQAEVNGLSASAGAPGATATIKKTPTDDASKDQKASTKK